MRAPAQKELDRFTEFMRHLVAVPHDKIKARLEAEKAEKKGSKKKPTLHRQPPSA